VSSACPKAHGLKAWTANRTYFVQHLGLNEVEPSLDCAHGLNLDFRDLGLLRIDVRPSEHSRRNRARKRTELFFGDLRSSPGDDKGRARFVRAPTALQPHPLLRSDKVSFSVG